MPNPPKPFTSKLKDTFQFNDKFWRFDFEVIEPHQFEFEAGQYVSIQVNDAGERRSYSIASTPDVKHSFSLAVDVTPAGIGCNFLMNAEFGQEVNCLGPMGIFTVVEDSDEEALVFVATGSGIAPFMPMAIDQLRNKQSTRPIILYWGLRYEQDLFWLKEFEDMAEQYPHFSFYPVLSKAGDEWTLSRGHVTDVIEQHEYQEKTGFYMCGNQHMISDMEQLLVEKKGIDPKYVHHEKFY